MDAPPGYPDVATLFDHFVVNVMGRTPGALLTEYKVIEPSLPAQNIEPTLFIFARTTFGVPDLRCPEIVKGFFVDLAPVLPSNIYSVASLSPNATTSAIPSPSRSPAKGVLHVEIALFVLDVHAVLILKLKGGRVPAQSAVLGAKLFCAYPITQMHVYRENTMLFDSIFLLIILIVCLFA
jgi:hypothetical protein